RTTPHGPRQKGGRSSGRSSPNGVLERFMNDPVDHLHPRALPAAGRARGRRLALWSGVPIALQGLGRNKTRAFLATLGIIIGVGCVITMMGLAQGTALQMEQRIRNLGSNTLSVRPSEQRTGALRLGRDTGDTLTLDDSEAIAAECPAVLR